MIEKIILTLSVVLVLLGFGEKLPVKPCKSQVQNCKIILLDTKIEEVD